MLKIFFTNTLIYGLAPQLPKIAGLFILPLITPYLTEEDFGLFGLVLAYVGALSVLQILGFHIVITNSFFKYPKKYKFIWRQIHGFLSVWSIGYTLLLGIVLYFFIPVKSVNEKLLIILFNCIPALLYNTTELFAVKFYQLRQKPIPLSIRTILVGLIAIFANWYTIAYLKMGYIGWLLSIFLSSTLSFISYIYPIYVKNHFWPIFNYKLATIKRLVKVSLPTIPHYYSSYLLNGSDRVIMNNLNIPINEIGIYNVASTFGNYFNTFSEAMNLAVGPLYPKLYKENTEESLLAARRITFFLQFITLLISFSICLLLREIYQILIKNEEIQQSYKLGIILIMAYNYRPMYNGSLQPLFFYEKTKLLWRISFIGGVISVLLNIVLLPYFGVEGANISRYIAFMYIGYAGFYMKEWKSIKSHDYYPARWLMLTTIVTAFVYAISDISLMYRLSILVILLVSVLIYIIKHEVYKKLKFI
jgi:O-antigen/teichoic acid export membrane protein